MAFNSGIMWNMADSGATDMGDFGSDFDWYDGGHDFVSPANGGYPGGIPGYDNYAVGSATPTGGGAADTGINPLTGNPTMDFTGMAPNVVDTSLPGSLDFGPGAVTMPSGGVYDILNTPSSPTTNNTSNDWTPLTVGGDILNPNDYAGAADNLVVNQGPTLPGNDVDTTGFGDYLSGGNIPGNGSDITGPVVPVGGDDNVPTMTITDNRPVNTVEDDIPTMTITDNRPFTPVTPVTPEDDVPTMTITDTRPPVVPVTPEDDVPTMTITDTRPVKPVEPEPEIPTLTITDTRPPVVPPEPPIIDIFPPVEPPIVEPPPPPPEPPIVEPPPLPPIEIVDPLPPVPPVVPPVPPVVPPVPPIVEPPVTPPQPPVATGQMINPGWIQPQAFYNTTNPAQSKFFWGGHGPQFVSGNPAQPFNAQAYNQAAAPNTPWGLGQVAAPLSPADMQAIIAGNYQRPQGTAPATRAAAYSAPTQAAPQYGQVKVGMNAGTTAPVTAPVSPSATKEMYTADQKSAISTALGSDWQSRLDKAALNGDYATIVDIQNQINAVLNPVVDRY